MPETLSLFPLHTVLFPGSVLQLKIFEQRYLDLIKTCMKQNHGFIVVLIESGNEVDDTPKIYSVGTYVEITDWESLDNGLLGITIKSRYKVQIKNTRVQHDGLLSGEIENILDTEDTSEALFERYQHLIEVLETLVQHPLLKAHYADINYHSGAEVSYRLSEFLPTTNLHKQELLETLNVEDRLIKLDGLLLQLQDQP